VTAEIARLETRLAGSRRKSAQEAWEPPQLADFAPGITVMAFDGSLGNTGWVRLLHLAGDVLIIQKGTIRPKTELDGYLGTWERAAQLRMELEALGHLAIGCSYIAVEAPMVAGGHRTESSLVAGLQVWQWAAHRAGIARRLDVGATHVSKVLLGSARVSKDDRKNAIKAAVARYIPGSEGRGFNEHERDAAAIALTVLHDLAHR
jgi:Holliday junction resolvasome RuvABC endonuclease subunit